MKTVYNPLQLREVFHLEFLRWFFRKARAENFSLKGGANLRFFFNSFRYSEDMDLDAYGIRKDILLDILIETIKNSYFQDSLKPFGIEKIIPPDTAKAKQTETTQRFKIHLMTYAGEDLFTKIEFSRRGFRGETAVEAVSDAISRFYKLPPLLVPHYNAQSAMTQKIEALGARSIIQARDVFDLYILSSQHEYAKTSDIKIEKNKLNKAYGNVFEITFKQFRDTVVSYLLPEDQAMYNNESSWDEVKLKTSGFIEELRNRYAQ